MLDLIDEYLWSYGAVPALILLGSYLTFFYGFPQIRLIIKFFKKDPRLSEVYRDSATQQNSVNTVSPWEAFFASLGGCIGIGNVVAVCTAIQIGGPGALIWMQVAAFLGMMIKYSEVYLSLTTREPFNNEPMGGPFIYLKKTQAPQIIGTLFALLLAIYSVDVYMFKVVADTMTMHFHCSALLSFALVYFSLLFCAQKGIKLVGKICGVLIPLFLLVFLILSFGVLYYCADNILPSIKAIVLQAFGLQPAFGGTVGATLMLTISEGVKRGCYSGDIGVGYAGLVHAKATEPKPKYQGVSEILGVLIDTFLVCTLSTFVIIVANTYTLEIPASDILRYTFAQYFSSMDIFFPLMIILLGFSTLLTFFYVGRQCLSYLYPQWGSVLYSLYSFLIFALFLFQEQTVALTFMSLVGALLLLLNCWGIFQHRKAIEID